MLWARNELPGVKRRLEKSEEENAALRAKLIELGILLKEVPKEGEEWSEEKQKEIVKSNNKTIQGWVWARKEVGEK